ncbi:MAG: type II secretion system protein C [Sulfurimonas sp.]|jgi:type II secretion system protein C|uniref:PDZ domain-containing protein n=1 Tax=Sulfurimonas sp. TaxID=2022749 RepID=UPI0039E3422C
MTKLSKPYLLGVATLLLVLLAVAKAIALLLWWFLPNDGIELKVDENYRPKYQRVDFSNMITTSNRRIKTPVTQKNHTSTNITNMLLKGLYGSKYKGFAIVALKSSPTKTSVISVGEVFAGYELKEILADGVVFRKNTKNYVLKMFAGKGRKNAKSFIKPVQYIDNSLPKKVSKSDIKEYAKNPKKIWNDIAITQVKKGNKVEGFKVTRVNRNSQIAKLGLQKNDLIIRVNNMEMTSYKQALKLYKEIDTLKSIQIVVLRNNEEQELAYEIQ